MALERGEVVEELRRLALLLLLELRDLAGLAGRRPRRSSWPRPPRSACRRGSGRVEALAGRREARLDEPVGLGLEGADLLLAAGDERERRRLDAAERDGAVEGGAQPDRRRARRVHADQPVGLGARARRLLERRISSPVAQVLEGLGDRRLRHRVEPQPLDRLLHAGGLVDVGEDQLALAPGVAGVDDQLDVVRPS